MSASEAARRLGVPPCRICQRTDVEVEFHRFRADTSVFSRVGGGPFYFRTGPVTEANRSSPVLEWAGDACASCWIDFLKARLQEELEEEDVVETA